MPASHCVLPGSARGTHLHGDVTLTGGVPREGNCASGQGSSGDAGDGLPMGHRVEAVHVGCKGRAVGPGWYEDIAGGGEDGDEPLQTTRRSEALHHPLALSQRDMRILGPVVEPLV